MGLFRNIFIAGFLMAGAATAAPAGPSFVVVPSSVQPPQGVELGSFRRSIQPFKNWTLICDEDLKKKQRICNVRQEIAIEGAGTIFSWAMAASDTGEPKMLATLPAAVGEGGEVVLTFDGDAKFSTTADCTQRTCSALIPVGPQIRRHITEKFEIRISFDAEPVGRIEFAAPMEGLGDALEAVGENIKQQGSR